MSYAPSRVVTDGQGAPQAKMIGITLVGLEELQDKVMRHNQHHPDNPIRTTSDISTRIVKPETEALAAGEQLYAHLDGFKHCGIPEYFVSHAWLADGLGLLEAVTTHGAGVVAAGKDTPVYYLDLVSIDQHQIDQAAHNSAMSFETMSNVFVKQIKACGEVVVVVEPFDAPKVTTRAWCLFEVAIAKSHGMPITVVLPPSQKSRLRDEIVASTSDDVLVKVMGAIDSSNAQATVAADRENIHRIIENDIEGSYLAVDEVYKGVIRQWIASLLEELIATFDPGSEAQATFVSEAGMLMDTLGDVDQSLVHQQRALQIYIELHGQLHPHVASCFNNLGVVYDRQGEHERAIKLFEQARQIEAETLCPNHPHVVSTLNNLGMAYRRQGDMKKAAEYYELALAVESQESGPDATKITVYNNLATILCDQGDRLKAIEYVERSLHIRTEVYGADHPENAISFSNLGSLYTDLGEHATAAAFYNRALTLRLKLLGPEHLDVAHCYHALGAMYESVPDYPAALAHLTKALEIREAALGPEHLDVAASCYSIATVHDAQREGDLAIELFNRALQIKQKILGSDHADLVMIYNSLGAAYLGLAEDIPTALSCFNHSLRIRIAVLGAEHIEVAETYRVIGAAHTATGDHPAAIECFEKAVPILVAAHGSNHVDVAHTYVNLAEAHTANGDLSTALENFKAAHCIFLAVRGPEDESTLALARLMAMAT